VEQVNQPLTAEFVIADLKRQRCEFVKQVEAGQPLVQASIDFIDNMLAQLVPGYVPAKGCGCGCSDKGEK
jgi:hypothetical protein